MSNAAHERLAKVATRLIAKNGRAASLIVETNSGSSFNPSVTETLVPVTIVQVAFMSDEVDGDLVRAGDLRFLMDSSVKPENDMKLRDGITDYSIIPVSDVTPGDVTMIYKVQARI